MMRSGMKWRGRRELPLELWIILGAKGEVPKEAKGKKKVVPWICSALTLGENTTLLGKQGRADMIMSRWQKMIIKCNI
jgi:hypothetical protein